MRYFDFLMKLLFLKKKKNKMNILDANLQLI